MTRTPRAFGAQTANDVPAASGLTRAPSTVHSVLVPALADQVQVDLAERGQVPVRVVGHGLRRCPGYVTATR